MRSRAHRPDRDRLVARGGDPGPALDRPLVAPRDYVPPGRLAFNQAAPDLLQGDIDLNLQVECNVRVDGVPNGAGGYADGVCDPTQGFRFSDLTRENFGKILTKRGHRVIELAARFDF